MVRRYGAGSRKGAEAMRQAVLTKKCGDTTAAETKAVRAAGGLRIGEPNDAFEQEADRLANEVMANGRSKLEWSLSQARFGVRLRRKCACGGSAGPEAECKECKEKESLQRRAAGTITPTTVPPIVHDVLRSPGQSLDAESRAWLEELRRGRGN